MLYDYLHLQPYIQCCAGLSLVCLGGLLILPGAYVSHLAYLQQRLPEI